MIKTNIQIRFSDVDMLRHVNNAVLQQYYDTAKSDYFSQVLGIKLLCQDRTFTTASTTTDYIEEVRANDTIYVTTTISKVGTKSITITQEIIDNESQCIKSRSTSILVAFNLPSRTSIELSQEWRELITNHESHYL